MIHTSSASSSPLSFIDGDPADPISSGEEEESAQFYIDSILELYHGLARLPKLEPSHTVNMLFSRLVELCRPVLDDSLAQKVCLEFIA